MSHTYNGPKRRRESQREKRKWGESGEKMNDDEKRNEKKERKAKGRMNNKGKRKHGEEERKKRSRRFVLTFLERECPPSL